jgi:hypothetical protein
MAHFTLDVANWARGPFSNSGASPEFACLAFVHRSQISDRAHPIRPSLFPDALPLPRTLTREVSITAPAAQAVQGEPPHVLILRGRGMTRAQPPPHRRSHKPRAILLTAVSDDLSGLSSSIQDRYMRSRICSIPPETLWQWGRATRIETPKPSNKCK